ncbi:hypothetical protein AZF37_02840 [endosymbiont 'TC1' of Trimyema compressum]|uniref:ArsR/SmtB family transcription factor n=1 Tax=endosymbiont 'TC1' of Trimyema compressum TaxID=243899 RepID=UPI0007F054A5|nr:metalloregulator ArsR/SmtB family transcription factor [endosymbiont 'TC1' of Trimyema compressum]AMP20250.1 hypothetical protein AZF37_02840 [endosymbiont 'TC1' of Trimyema compressum]
MKLDYCYEDHHKDEEVARLQKKMLPEDVAIDCAYLMKSLGDKNRINILYLLTQIDKICASEFSDILQISQPLTSHQLRILKQMDLIKCSKKGKSVYYSLKEKTMKPLVETIIKLSDLI